MSSILACSSMLPRLGFAASFSLSGRQGKKQVPSSFGAAKVTQLLGNSPIVKTAALLLSSSIGRLLFQWMGSLQTDSHGILPFCDILHEKLLGSKSATSSVRIRICFPWSVLLLIVFVRVSGEKHRKTGNGKGITYLGL